MPNLGYMVVQWGYLAALMVWVGGMLVFAAVFVPSLIAALPREHVGPVIAAFLPRFRNAVTVCIVVLVVTSAIKVGMWEQITGWLLARWGLLAGMTLLALYDFKVLAPRLAHAKATGDEAGFARVHRIATSTMGITLVMGLAVLFLS